MRREVFALVLPLIVIPCVAALIVGIGSLLLAVGEELAVPVALALTFAVIFGAMYMGRPRGDTRAP